MGTAIEQEAEKQGWIPMERHEISKALLKLAGSGEHKFYRDPINKAVVACKISGERLEVQANLFDVQP